MAVIKLVQFDIKKKPGRMALSVEAEAFTIKSFGSSWKAVENVEFDDPIVNVRITLKGQAGEEYEMKMKTNGKSKDITGTLEKSGKNFIKKDYSITEFGISL